METQRKTGEPETRRRQPAPAQIGDDDSLPSDAIELAKHGSDFISRKVMKELGAEHQVKGIVAKGQLAGASGHCMGKPRPGDVQKVGRLIDSESDYLSARSTELRGYRRGDVGETGADIEDHQWVRARGDALESRPDGGTPPAKNAVRAAHVSDGAYACRCIDR
jgi:hypothetical protein